ncbi:hypothetical protein GHT09_012861 [Marmota monax]|uniref:Uncharacterized protein n=1 Tax=Marmota monax TaxID=9995 RepID=A0A834QGH7_MARMO|nr:hypothetical protein GHT09_012861 [Marmota monax]
MASPTAHSWNICRGAGLESGTPNPEVTTPSRNAAVPPPASGSGEHKVLTEQGRVGPWRRGAVPASAQRGRGRRQRGELLLRQWASSAAAATAASTGSGTAALCCFGSGTEAQLPERALTTPRLQAASPQTLARAGRTPIVRTSQ